MPSRAHARVATPTDAAAVKAYAQSIGRVCTDEQAETFFNHFQAVGWVDKNNIEIRDWQARLVTWLLADKNKANKPGPSIDPKRHTKW